LTVSFATYQKMNIATLRRNKNRKFKIALIDPLTGVRPHYIPTGLCYLSAYLKRDIASQIDIKILSLSLQTINKLYEYDPDLIGFTALTHNFNLVRQMVIKIKQNRKNIMLVLGGQHISMAPWSMPEEFDYAILGEGEEAFLKFTRSLLSNSIMDNQVLPGIQYWNDGKLTAVSKLPLIESLDDIPFPDRDGVEDIESIITIDSYRKFNKSGLRTMQVTTSRGCPYKCKFCQPSIMWEKFRMHSPEYIAEEIDYIVAHYGINAVHIEDDLFVSNKNRISALIDLLGKKNLLHKIKYYAAGRTKQIDEEWVILLKQLGVVKVEFGIESGADAIAQYLKSDSSSSEISKSAISLLNREGISVYASFIAGSPPETPADLEQTWRMIKWIKNNHKQNSCGLSLATPLPGTQLWEYALQNGIINQEEIDWDKLNSLAKFPKDESKYFHLNDKINAKRLLRKVRFINFLMWLGTPGEFITAIPRRISKIPHKLSTLLYNLKS
jgi:anaerobic magnesium-protoporphyrin IX monomethyl ester cyclase